MEILKAATDWAKAELVSTSFIIFFGFLFLLLALGFWQTAKTDIANAYVIPILVGGLLQLAIGLSLIHI